MNIIEKIEAVQRFITYVKLKNSFSNKLDIRSATLQSLEIRSYTYLLTLLMTKENESIDYTSKLPDHLKLDDILHPLSNRYQRFIADSYFIKLFASTENHIRQIAEHYESNENQLNVPSISKTFRNLVNPKKLGLFSSISQEDIDLFTFYCYLRNTIHHMGLQIKSTQKISIRDPESVVITDNVDYELQHNSRNEIPFEHVFLLQEQVIKLLLKMNTLLPVQDYIEHRLIQIGEIH